MGEARATVLLFRRKGPRRRARERPLVKAAAVAVVVAGAVAGAGTFSRAHYAPGGRGDSTPVLAVKPEAVRRVIVASKDRRVELTRTEEGRWQGGPGVPPATETLMISSEEEIFPLQAFRTVQRDAVDPQFGLVDPDVTLEVEDADGRRHQVAFGAPTFTNGGFYARRPGEGDRLYLVPRRAVYDLRSMLAGHRIDPPNEVPKKVRELDEQAKARDERAKVNYWLRQSLESGTPLPDELK